MIPKVGEYYKHFKTGNLYKILAIGKSSENLEEMIVYEAQYENPESQVWVRPLKNFIEDVDWQGSRVKRFERV